MVIIMVRMRGGVVVFAGRIGSVAVSDGDPDDSLRELGGRFGELVADGVVLRVLGSGGRREAGSVHE